MKYLDKEEFKQVNTFGTGIRNVMLAKNMTGKTYISPLTTAGGNMMLANVSFAPGARCFWHIHRATKGGGQILICTAGEGWYQEEGKEAIPLRPGMIITIPTDLTHWHGAKKDSWFSHIAVEIGGENLKNEFVHPVSEAEYAALDALDVASENNPDAQSDFDRANVFGKGEPNIAFAQYFTGQSYLNPLVKPEPGCRNFWHIHHASEGGGQILLCTTGGGWYQEEGKSPKTLNSGSHVYIPAGVKHWHGAKKDSWFSHIAIEVPGKDANNEWLEEVDDDHYNKL